MKAGGCNWGTRLAHPNAARSCRHAQHRRARYVYRFLNKVDSIMPGKVREQVLRPLVNKIPPEVREHEKTFEHVGPSFATCSEDCPSVLFSFFSECEGSNAGEHRK